MLTSLIKIFCMRWVFQKPSKKNLLIYDLDLVFKKFVPRNEYEILDIRYQSVNLYILILTFLKTGLSNFIENYKKNYLISVSPKVVLTSTDNNMSFFKLKNLYQKSLYVCVQFSLRDKIFINQCKLYYKENNFPKLYSDFFFVYGNNDALQLKKYIKSRFVVHGSTINNLFKKKASSSNKLSKIMFISQVSQEIGFKIEKKIFKKIINLSKELNMSLFYLLKYNNKNVYTKEIKDYFQKDYSEKKFKYIERSENSYKYLNLDALFISRFSTLAFEAISRKKRVIFLSPSNFPSKTYGRKYAQNGPFWTINYSYDNIKKIVKKILKLKEKNWSEIVDQQVSDIIVYKYLNPDLVKLLKKNNIKTYNQNF